MIRLSSLLSVLVLTSISAFADPSQLLGKWAGGCNQYGLGSSEYALTVSEFLADGTGSTVNQIHGNSQCTGPVLRTDGKIPATYVATDSELVVKFRLESREAVLVAQYKILGDSLLVTPTAWTVDGKAQVVPGPATLHRLQ